MRFAKRSLQLKGLRDVNSFDELSRSPVIVDTRDDYETVNQMEDDAPPRRTASRRLRRLNSIRREGKWFMIARRKRDGDLYLATADLVSREYERTG